MRVASQTNHASEDDMDTYQDGYRQGVLDRRADIAQDGHAYGEVALSDESPWAYGYRDGYLAKTDAA